MRRKWITCLRVFIGAVAVSFIVFVVFCTIRTSEMSDKHKFVVVGVFDII